MNETNPNPSRKNILCSLEKFYFDNYLNIDERLSLNDNFNQNQYEENQKQAVRNSRKMKTEPPKNVCDNEKEGRGFYPAFFQRIFKSISQNISNSDSKKATNEKEETNVKRNHVASLSVSELQRDASTQIEKTSVFDRFRSTMGASKNERDFVDEHGRKMRRNKTEARHIGKRQKSSEREREKKEVKNKVQIRKEKGKENKEKREENNSETDSDEEEETESDTEDSEKGKNADGMHETRWSESTIAEKRETGTCTDIGENKNNSKNDDGDMKSKSEVFTNKSKVKAKNVENDDVISKVFQGKNVKTLVVGDTGGIDIEIIEGENPEYLYYTNSGTIVSNMYYEVDDSLRNKELFTDKKGKRDHTLYRRRDSSIHTKKGESNTNKKGYTIFGYKGGSEKVHEDNSKGKKIFTNKNCSKDNIPGGSEKNVTDMKQNDLAKRFTKKTSSESYKAAESSSFLSSASFHVSDKRKRKKYYYIGETYKNKRNGWGMLIYNDRVIFEGEYKMDHALGYFVKYNEYSTEFGYRSPICIQSVSIMSDQDNFIIQNKNSCDSDKEESNEMELEMEMERSIEVQRTRSDEKEKQEEKETHLQKAPVNSQKREDEHNEAQKLMGDSNNNDGCEWNKQKEEKHMANVHIVSNDAKEKSYSNKSYGPGTPSKGCSKEIRGTEILRNKNEMTHWLEGMKEQEEKEKNEKEEEINKCENTDEEENNRKSSNEKKQKTSFSKLMSSLNEENIGAATKSQSLHVSTNSLRRNSKHKTSPARSINYLKPPVITMVRNDCYMNKQTNAPKTGKPIIRRSYKCKTTHLITPMNIIITSMDSDNEKEYPITTDKKGNSNESVENANEPDDVVESSANDILLSARSMTNIVSGSVSECASLNETIDGKEKEGHLEKKNDFPSNKTVAGEEEEEDISSDVLAESRSAETPHEDISDIEKNKKEGQKLIPFDSKNCADDAKNEIDSNALKNNEKENTVTKKFQKYKLFSAGINTSSSDGKENMKQKQRKICFLNNTNKENTDDNNNNNNNCAPNKEQRNKKHIEFTPSTESMYREEKKVIHNENGIHKNVKNSEKLKRKKNRLKVKDYDQHYKQLLFENINNDNYAIKNNKITTFRKFFSSNFMELNTDMPWREYINSKNRAHQEGRGETEETAATKIGKMKKRKDEMKTKENDEKSAEHMSEEKTNSFEGYSNEKEKQNIEKGKEEIVKQDELKMKEIVADDKRKIETQEEKVKETKETEETKKEENSESKEVPRVSPFTVSLQNELEKKWAELSPEEKNTMTKTEYRKILMRKKLRGATFPETHDDRQKNCFLFNDDYLTSNEEKFNVVNEDFKLRASDYNKWSVNMLYNFLKMIGLKKEAYLFKINRLRGYNILKLTDKELQNMNITNCYVRKFVLTAFRFLVNSLDNADPLSLNFNTHVKFSFDQITNIANTEVSILKKIGGGSYAQVFKARYKNAYVACKIFMYNPKQLNEETYCESYISTPRSSQNYILPKMKLDENFNIVEDKNGNTTEKYFASEKDRLQDMDFSHTLQMNKKIKKMANVEIFRYFPTPVKYRNYEAKILYALQTCKHVIKMLGVCSLKEGEESIVLQYCNGGSLEKYIYADERRVNTHYLRYFSRPKIVKLFQQVAEGMHYIHCHQYFHRDLKLSNILIDENEEAVISDFGLSTSFSKSDSPSAYAIYGNIFYAAPEVLKGEGFFKESDVWSFGVSLWEALSRQIAYDGYTSSEVYCKVASGELSLNIPKDIPTELSTLLKSMLHPDFRKRPLFHVIAKKLRYIVDSAENKLHADITSFFGG